VLRRRLLVLAAFSVVVGVPLLTGGPSEASGPCPKGMAYVAGEGQKAHAFCIDKWEAGVVEIRGRKEEHHSPYEPVSKLKVKAVTRPGHVPQGYISKNEADEACKNAHKRLCSGEEWLTACRGKNPTSYPYGDERKDGYCNDNGRSNVNVLYKDLGDAAYASPEAMNDPRINKQPDSVARTGQYEHCRNAYGIFDMVGNLHEWTSELVPYEAGMKGVFRGGYYQDTSKNGIGCNYKTVAHDVAYHDYSTGFRCCADPR
jgi:formylglycine-generating enzyme required for sulfatase activity